METEKRIEAYIDSQPEPKRSEMLKLHRMISDLDATQQLWFLDGTDEHGRTVSNPNIGYGSYTMRYADGKSRTFYRIGLSANTTGISVYIMGIKDRNFLAETFGKTLGKASISGYCIKFRTLEKIDVGVLASAITYGLAQTADGIHR